MSYNKIETFDTTAPIHKALLKIFVTKTGRNPDVLFLEDSNTFHDADSALNLRAWLIENKVEHNVLFRVSELPFDYLTQSIREHDIIIFQTTGTREIANKVAEYMLSMDKGWQKTVIECYVYEPKFMRMPAGCRHRMYALDAFHPIMPEWKLSKLQKSKSWFDTFIVYTE